MPLSYWSYFAKYDAEKNWREKHSKVMQRARLGRSLEMRADVLPHLVMPVGPFVAAFRAPVV